jgi:hypothetical protein
MMTDYTTHKYRNASIPQRATLQQFFNWLAVNTVDKQGAYEGGRRVQGRPQGVLEFPRQVFAEHMGYETLSDDAAAVLADMASAHSHADLGTEVMKIAYRDVAKEHGLSARCLGPVTPAEKCIRQRMSGEEWAT